jgi:hypothetical protein
MAIARSAAGMIARSESNVPAQIGMNQTLTSFARAKSEVKRQRTGSRSPSGSPVLESDDEGSKNAAPKQKPRGAAARSQREKEQRDKERERERAEAANRRKGRAERRKVDGKLTGLARET